MDDPTSINFYDHVNDCNAYACIQKKQNMLSISISIESNGDIDILVDQNVAKIIADAIYKNLDNVMPK